MKNKFSLDDVIDIITEIVGEAKNIKHRIALVRVDHLEFLIKVINELKKGGEK